MIVRVDKDLCTGCGLCVDACPDVFELDGALAVVRVSPVPAAIESTCRDAANGCPVSAIAVEE